MDKLLPICTQLACLALTLSLRLFLLSCGTQGDIAITTAHPPGAERICADALSTASWASIQVSLASGSWQSVHSPQPCQFFQHNPGSKLQAES